MTFASAMPEKRLFVSLITRDITLADAILDLADNSVNAAMYRVSSTLDSAEAFYSSMERMKPKQATEIRIDVSDDCIEITDNAGGIDAETAKKSVFHFGTPLETHSAKDRLSVFGIGMKRAMFKIGNKILITSDHPEGGFFLDLNARQWERTPQTEWGFEIVEREKCEESAAGTNIKITELHEDVRKRVADPTFIPALKEKLAKTYAFFLGRLVTIVLNESEIDPIVFEIGENFAHERFKVGEVEYNITAGIAQTSEHSTHTQENAGWFVFCNGRALLYADKTAVTGRGAGILPVFQPKHRPFVGFVFFYSAFPEELPWTTTKDTVNEENAAWQDAKRNMAALARPIIRILDGRYNDNESDRNDIAALAGPATTASFDASVAQTRAFSIPEKKKRAATTSIQYTVLISELQAVKKHLGRSSISGSSVGRLTFDYYLRNEVGTK